MIAIKDMKMPKSCWECPFYELGAEIDRCILNNAYFVIDYNSKNRGKYCPLVEVK